MDVMELEQVVRNINDRVAGIEQILPTLATKEDLKAFATKEDLKAFATKEDLKAYATKEDLQAAIAPLVTRTEMQAAIKEEGERTRQHFNAVAERLEGKFEILAEAVVALTTRFDDFQVEVRREFAKVDRRLLRLEAAR